MASYAVTSLRNAQPNSRIVWAIDQRCAPVIDDGVLVNRALITRREHLRAQNKKAAASQDLFRLMLQARKERPDTALVFQGHIKNLLCARVSGAKRISCAPSRDGLVQMFGHPLPTAHPDQHQIDRFYDIATVLWPLEKVERPSMPNLQEVVAPIISEPFVSISIASNSPHRTYPAQKWAEVGKRLQSEGIGVAWIGGPGYSAPELPNSHDLVGKLSLRESMKVIAQSGLHLCADTGTGHLAAAYGVPVASIFGPTSEKQYLPRGSKAVALRQGSDPADVAVDEVFTHAMRLIRIPVA